MKNEGCVARMILLLSARILDLPDYNYAALYVSALRKGMLYRRRVYLRSFY